MGPELPPRKFDGPSTEAIIINLTEGPEDRLKFDGRGPGLTSEGQHRYGLTLHQDIAFKILSALQCFSA